MNGKELKKEIEKLAKKYGADAVLRQIQIVEAEEARKALDTLVAGRPVKAGYGSKKRKKET